MIQPGPPFDLSARDGGDVVYRFNDSSLPHLAANAEPDNGWCWRLADV
jgi:hypothetical protein